MRRIKLGVHVTGQGHMTLYVSSDASSDKASAMATRSLSRGTFARSSRRNFQQCSILGAILVEGRCAPHIPSFKGRNSRMIFCLCFCVHVSWQLCKIHLYLNLQRNRQAAMAAQLVLHQRASSSFCERRGCLLFHRVDHVCVP